MAKKGDKVKADEKKNVEKGGEKDTAPIKM